MSIKNNIQIVPATEEHIAECARISVSAYEVIHEAYKELLGAELHDNVMKDWREKKAASIERQLLAGNSFVALLDGKVAGFIGYRLEGEIGVIANNAVDHEYRGNGIGGMLHKKVFDELKKQGIRFVKVLTGLDDGHAPARRAYEKSGFEKFLPSLTYYMDLSEQDA